MGLLMGIMWPGMGRESKDVGQMPRHPGKWCHHGAVRGRTPVTWTWAHTEQKGPREMASTSVHSGDGNTGEVLEGCPSPPLL